MIFYSIFNIFQPITDQQFSAAAMALLKNRATVKWPIHAVIGNNGLECACIT